LGATTISKAQAFAVRITIINLVAIVPIRLVVIGIAIDVPCL